MSVKEPLLHLIGFFPNILPKNNFLSPPTKGLVVCSERLSSHGWNGDLSPHGSALPVVPLWLNLDMAKTSVMVVHICKIIDSSSERDGKKPH